MTTALLVDMGIVDWAVPAPDLVTGVLAMVVPPGVWRGRAAVSGYPERACRLNRSTSRM